MHTLTRSLALFLIALAGSSQAAERFSVTSFLTPQQAELYESVSNADGEAVAEGISQLQQTYAAEAYERPCGLCNTSFSNPTGLRDHEQISRLECGHMFCRLCLHPKLLEARKCPAAGCGDERLNAEVITAGQYRDFWFARPERFRRYHLLRCEEAARQRQLAQTAPYKDFVKLALTRDLPAETDLTPILEHADAIRQALLDLRTLQVKRFLEYGVEKLQAQPTWQPGAALLAAYLTRYHADISAGWVAARDATNKAVGSNTVRMFIGGHPSEGVRSERAAYLSPWHATDTIAEALAQHKGWEAAYATAENMVFPAHYKTLYKTIRMQVQNLLAFAGPQAGGSSDHTAFTLAELLVLYAQTQVGAQTIERTFLMAYGAAPKVLALDETFALLNAGLNAPAPGTAANAAGNRPSAASISSASAEAAASVGSADAQPSAYNTVYAQALRTSLHHAYLTIRAAASAPNGASTAK